MLTIGYIHPGTVRAEFCESLLMAALRDQQAERLIGGVLSVPTSILAHGRNALAHQFLQTDDRWLLMVDTDVTFTLEDIYALVAADKPIIGGLCLMRHGEHQPNWTLDGFVPCLDVRPEPMPMNSVGMAFTLIHRDALEKVRAEHADDPWPWFGHDLILGTRAGEDVTFCHRARQLGIEVWGHGAVHVGHVATTTLVPLDHTLKEN